VIQTSKSADIRSRSFELKALFQNSPDRWFKPGMFVKVRARLSPHDNALVIPAGAIVSDGVTNRVFLIRNGKAFQKVVTLGVSDGERTEVLGGLALLDTVATTGATNLKDSSFVNIVLTK
jgi:multidrug efflux pump subunit AcrA (membrane-fusion protein)